jgi:16S rRNA (guanine(966)-N(2))-methyltransferase RsmD
MKIGGGKFRGMHIEAPPGRKTRPTGGRLKKSLFDILAPRLRGSRVLDLFAGAGALGLEALSRGASHVTFVERNRGAAEAIRKNLERLGLTESAELLRREAASAISSLAEREDSFDLVLLDPPYRSHNHASLLQRIGAASLARPGGLVILEHHHKTPLADSYAGLTKVREVRAGESCLSFFQSQPSA